jgi:hypothetical protein
MGLSLCRPAVGATASGTSILNKRMFSTHGFVNRLPKRILLIRHGESLGNYDETAYTHTPDWTIPLTPEGVNQSKELGRKLRDIVGNGLEFDFYLIL